MKNNFTPAPWTVLNIVYPTKGFVIVSERSLDNEVDFDVPLNRKIVENAPQMYQALRTILAYAEAHGGIPVILDAALGVILDIEGEPDKKVG